MKLGHCEEKSINRAFSVHSRIIESLVGVERGREYLARVVIIIKKLHWDRWIKEIQCVFCNITKIMSFVPRIELEIQEDESILRVNQTPPCPSVFLFKIRVNHSINVLYPTRKLQGFAGVATRICELLEPVKIGQISTTMYCPLHQFLSHDTAERFFYRALEVFCVPVDQGIEDIATRFSSEIVFMALDASFNRRDIVPVVVEIKSDLWLQYCPGTVEHFIAGYVGRLMERGARVDISSGQLVERIDLKHRPMEQCRICLESLGGEEPALQQPCSHIYHLSCARMWFEDSPSCPMCRIGID